MNSKTDKKLVEIVCQAWNTLDSSLFDAILSGDFEYISVWVIETMTGKDRYLKYIRGKFESIRRGDKPVSAKILYQEAIGKYVVVLNQAGKIAALEPTIQDGLIKSLWMRPVGMTLPAVFHSQKSKGGKRPEMVETQEYLSPEDFSVEKFIVGKNPRDNHTYGTAPETKYGKFSQLFLEALKAKDFSLVENLMADDVSQILYDAKEIVGKKEVIAYWLGWLDRWKEPAESTVYEVKNCSYYDREVLSIKQKNARNLYQMARFENGLVRQLVLCPNPLQNNMIRHWDLDHFPLLFRDHTLIPLWMGKDLEPRSNRIPCLRCGSKSEKLQWYEYHHNTGPLSYDGELSVCTNCMEAVEFLPTVLSRNQ